MKRSTRYGERDYAFGQVMLTLRMSIGLTQVGLADLLGVSRRAVGDWEAGLSYPTTEHLKQLILAFLVLSFLSLLTMFDNIALFEQNIQ